MNLINQVSLLRDLIKVGELVGVRRVIGKLPLDASELIILIVELLKDGLHLAELVQSFLDDASSLVSNIPDLELDLSNFHF